MAFFLAVDVGGTKTDYLLADESAELCRTRTGTIKRMRTDASSAAANLDQALDELTARSGVSMRAITRTCVGTAGETVPLVTDWLRQAFSARVSGDLLLLGDVEIALDAAFHGGIGVLAMAGTGSNVAGRRPDSSVVTAGGWGPELADQGSGHRIGHEGLRAVFMARDEGRSTLLLDAIMAFWEVPSLGLLVEAANARPAPDFSRLTEVFLDCARKGDAVASEVLRQQGKELAWLVRLVIRQVYAATAAAGSGRKAELPSVALTGSIMEKVPPVREALVADIRSEFPAIHVREGVVDPLLGALWRAQNPVLPPGQGR